MVLGKPEVYAGEHMIIGLESVYCSLTGLNVSFAVTVPYSILKMDETSSAVAV